MKVKERNGWKSLNKDFETWYQANYYPDWKRQKLWLSKELIKRAFIKEKDLLNMWIIFHSLTDNCSSWNFQSKVLSFITLCMNDELGEELGNHVS